MCKWLKGFLGVTILIVGLLSLTAKPLAAQYSIPAGSTIYSATLSVWLAENEDSSGQNVFVYRIIKDWGEQSVTWNNFGGAGVGYDPIPVTSFSTSGVPGWRTIDLTSLVALWFEGTFDNFGIVLRAGATPWNLYYSSDNATIAWRPKLEIGFIPPGGVLQYFTIQRTESTSGVEDTYIWESEPAANNGLAQYFWTGNYSGKEKYSLLKFSFSVTPPGPGTGTPGYWKNHPEAWCVDSILGYSKETAISLMGMGEAGDKRYTMFAALVAAMLNVNCVGTDSSCIADTIAAANAWWSTYGGNFPTGQKITGNSAAWKLGEPLYMRLDMYNNGELCAPHRY